MQPVWDSDDPIQTGSPRMRAPRPANGERDPQIEVRTAFSWQSLACAE